MCHWHFNQLASWASYLQCQLESTLGKSEYWVAHGVQWTKIAQSSPPPPLIHTHKTPFTQYVSTDRFDLFSAVFTMWQLLYLETESNYSSISTLESVMKTLFLCVCVCVCLTALSIWIWTRFNDIISKLVEETCHDFEPIEKMSECIDPICPGCFPLLLKGKSKWNLAYVSVLSIQRISFHTGSPENHSDLYHQRNLYLPHASTVLFTSGIDFLLLSNFPK